jgi:thiol-disulfide isomerase/thioredoxin
LSVVALAIGDACPAFDLPGTDDESHSLARFGQKVLVVIVSCNHCPHVVAYEPRMVRIAKEYQSKSVGFIAVNANDAVKYPTDGMAAMKQRAKERGFPFPYVRDDSQDFVRALGARCTPEVYVFDDARKLRYHGRIDDNSREASQVTKHDLKDALDALLAGKAPAVAETTAIGCSVKWR